MLTKYQKGYIATVLLGLTSTTAAITFGYATSPQLHEAECIIVTEYGRILTEPILGEDDGTVYCPYTHKAGNR